MKALGRIKNMATDIKVTDLIKEMVGSVEKSIDHVKEFKIERLKLAEKYLNGRKEIKMKEIIADYEVKSTSIKTVGSIMNEYINSVLMSEKDIHNNTVDKITGLQKIMEKRLEKDNLSESEIEEIYKLFNKILDIIDNDIREHNENIKIANKTAYFNTIIMVAITTFAMGGTPSNPMDILKIGKQALLKSD